MLAVGGELKNTFTITIGSTAHLSTHIGDMGSWEAQQTFDRAVTQMMSLRDAQPELIVCDLHPNYATTAYAERFADTHNLPLIDIQHHVAHGLSLLAEHGISHGPAVIATLDGTGYGTDGTIWGGEILTFGDNLTNWERSWHLPPSPSPAETMPYGTPGAVPLASLTPSPLTGLPPSPTKTWPPWSLFAPN